MAQHGDSPGLGFWLKVWSFKEHLFRKRYVTALLISLLTGVFVAVPLVFSEMPAWIILMSSVNFFLGGVSTTLIHAIMTFFQKPAQVSS